MIDTFELRNIRSSLDQLFPNNDLIIVNDENLFKVQSGDAILYTLDNNTFIFSVKSVTQAIEDSVWEALKHFCLYVFRQKMLIVLDNTSCFESVKK
jgi:hypothetical protein